MTKKREKNMALDLRSRGFSYSEIIDMMEEDGIKISKGSLSNWLRDVELTSEQRESIKENEARGRQERNANQKDVFHW